MIKWNPETEAANRKRELAIAVALIKEAANTSDWTVVRRLHQAALMHLEPLSDATAAA